MSSVVPRFISIPPLGLTSETITHLDLKIQPYKKDYPLTKPAARNYIQLRKYSNSTDDLCIDWNGRFHLLTNYEGILWIFKKAINLLVRGYYNVGVLVTRKWPSVFLADTAHAALKVHFYQFIFPRIPAFLTARKEAVEARRNPSNDRSVVDEMIAPQINEVLTPPNKQFEGKELISVLEKTAARNSLLHQKFGPLFDEHQIVTDPNEAMTNSGENVALARITHYFVGETGVIHPFWVDQKPTSGR